MSRLSLIIADSDTEYLAKLEKFLMVSYPQRYDIFSFPSAEKLTDFLKQPDQRDLLLLNVKLYEKDLPTHHIRTMLFLTEELNGQLPEGFDSIFKYQHTDVLFSEVLQRFARVSGPNRQMKDSGKTRTICIWSPSGGNGKTRVAAGCSVLGAGRGLKTFYLNLEHFPSTDTIFHSSGTQSMSNVIYHLKGHTGNLPMKLEAARSHDYRTGVYFFNPPEQILEMEELEPKDAALLLNALSSESAYDLLLIDLSCGFTPLNIEVMAQADRILLLLGARDVMDGREEALLGSIRMLEERSGKPLSNKLLTIRAAELGTMSDDATFMASLGPLMDGMLSAR